MVFWSCRKRSVVRLFFALCAALSMPLVAIAEPNKGPRYDVTPFENTLPEDNDPFEPVNRVMFQINRLLDGLLIKPAAQTYNAVVPETARVGVGNALTNLREPLGFASALLQCEGQKAVAHAMRFVFNSIFGLFGLVDVAGNMGLNAKSEGTEQYLARTGMKPGPYIVLPLFGPSDVRNTLGTIGDYFADPFNMAARSYKRGTYQDNLNAPLRYHSAKYRRFVPIRMAVSGLHARSRNVDSLDALERNSFDYYAAVRSAYQQQASAKNVEKLLEKEKN